MVIIAAAETHGDGMLSRVLVVLLKVKVEIFLSQHDRPECWSGLLRKGSLQIGSLLMKLLGQDQDSRKRHEQNKSGWRRRCSNGLEGSSLKNESQRCKHECVERIFRAMCRR